MTGKQAPPASSNAATADSTQDMTNGLGQSQGKPTGKLLALSCAHGPMVTHPDASTGHVALLPGSAWLHVALPVDTALPWAIGVNIQGHTCGKLNFTAVVQQWALHEITETEWEALHLAARRKVLTLFGPRRPPPLESATWICFPEFPATLINGGSVYQYPGALEIVQAHDLPTSNAPFSATNLGEPLPSTLNGGSIPRNLSLLAELDKLASAEADESDVAPSTGKEGKSMKRNLSLLTELERLGDAGADESPAKVEYEVNGFTNSFPRTPSLTLLAELERGLRGGSGSGDEMKRNGSLLTELERMGSSSLSKELDTLAQAAEFHPRDLH